MIPVLFKSLELDAVKSPVVGTEAVLARVRAMYSTTNYNTHKFNNGILNVKFIETMKYHIICLLIGFRKMTYVICPHLFIIRI